MVVTAGAQAAAPPPGPALQTPAPTLQAALTCSADLATASKTPVLLIPGTYESAEQVYSWGYQKVLRDQGHPVCMLELPDRGVGDMRTTAEWVVHAIRYMAATSGRKISMLGHSQGGLLQAWALRFWPDLPALVDDAMSLGSPYRGSRSTNDIVCALDYCSAFAWQVKVGSTFNTALTRTPIKAGPSYTSIGSTSDELIYPAPTATELPGAANIMIQDVCPGRVVGHLGAVADATAFALVMDALTHPDGASATRVGTASCGAALFDGVDTVGMTRLLGAIGDALLLLTFGPRVWAEPNLRDYALREPGDTDLARSRPVAVSSTESGTFPGANAVDGQADTRWSSGWSSPQWISGDLGRTRTVDGVRLTWESAYGSDYRIQTSADGVTWTTVWSTTSGNGGVDTIALPAVSARYVRMYGTQRATLWGYSLYNFEVFGR